MSKNFRDVGNGRLRPDMEKTVIRRSYMPLPGSYRLALWSYGSRRNRPFGPDFRLGRPLCVTKGAQGVDRRHHFYFVFSQFPQTRPYISTWPAIKILYHLQ